MGTTQSVKAVLENSGYEVVEGAENVSNAIGFDFSGEVLCSGFGVFPDGKKCPGCLDCRKEEQCYKK